ncbi:MAG TPA: helix-turn-helix domain-containing protein [Streptosporangiaceae bacterium]|nr:helix-turn-helix domain-containing protein [Streptosporangiaceae bacterium]
MTSEGTSGDALLEGLLSPRDPQAIRALAHPVRMALIELLAHRGTLTATQASEALGESPANCAFHLRTLAKYGFVEEAGGGRGRERPWRRTHVGVNLESLPGNPEYSAAVQALEDVALSLVLSRARAALAGRPAWPAQWQSRLGEFQTIIYLTPQEADELSDDLNSLLWRYQDRLDHPERRPEGVMPVEMVTLSYPLLHLPEVPGTDPAGPTGQS